MSQLNIIIVVQTEQLPSESGKISHPSECIYMCNDRSQASYVDFNKAELESFASAGDLLVWTILAGNPNENTNLNLTAIIDTTVYDDPINEVKLFNNNDTPFIFCNNQRACIAISDNIRIDVSPNYYCYKIAFEYNGTAYWWDPFVEPRGDEKV